MLGVLVGQAQRRLAEHGIAVLTTERERLGEHGGLAHGAAVMAGLTAVVRALGGAADGLITKGGITTAEVTTAGLDARVATVAGQIEVGIPLWNVDGTPVVVVPGNIGDADTLVRMVRWFSAS